jgi:hypothetical protein
VEELAIAEAAANAEADPVAASSEPPHALRTAMDRTPIDTIAKILRDG